MTTVKYIVRIDTPYGTKGYMQRRTTTLTMDKAAAGRFTKQHAVKIAAQYNTRYIDPPPWYGARVFTVTE